MEKAVDSMVISQLKKYIIKRIKECLLFRSQETLNLSLEIALIYIKNFPLIKLKMPLSTLS